MATSRRESQPTTRLNRTVRNTPVLKPSDSDQGLRRARSVPSSPDRRSSASTAAANSANACRPSSSFNPRTASSRSTSGSASSSSSTHGNKSTLLSSVSAMVGVKQAAGAMRRRADKSAGATSVWPHAIATPGTTSPNKDPASKAAKSPASNVQKSKLSTRPGGAEKAAASSPKPKAQKAATGAGKTLTTSSSARNPGAATAKRRTGLEISVPSIQRTTSVPAVAAPKAEAEQDVELLMQEFDEMESISTPSIEEHLQQRLPDPVDVTDYATSEDKNDQGVATEHMFSEERRQDLNGGSDADAGLDYEAVVAEEAVGETELNEAATEAGLKEPVDETEQNETVGGIELKGAIDEPMLNEAGSETEVTRAQSAVEEAKANEERTPDVVQRRRKDDGRSNEATEEGRSKTTMQERRNKVMALVGRFETVMSGRE